ncbi:MAG TPA: FAD-dependent oxidoreductase [Candidatus Binataceae bacterium]|nr:FAD-dependent oxidoreductase [Candidatus Binataceae bacterium]
MERHKYLIVGGGMTADSAVRGIRELDTSGSIGVIGSETVGPYDRPPLSKALWKGKSLNSIWRNTSEVAGVKLHLGITANRIDVTGHQVVDETGNEYSFDKLLLATGGTPRHLRFGEGSIIYYRTFDDYERLRALTDKLNRFAVIGAGFIGSEIAAALCMNGKQVTMVFPENGIGVLAYPADLSRAVTQLYQEKGVEVLTGVSVEGLQSADGATSLLLSGHRRILADTVIAGIGIIPNIDLAREANLEVSDGIVVNELLQTTAPNIYAAGDVARFFNPALNQRIRVEHEDNANTMGRVAGRNMAGAGERYTHLPSFYSDLFDIGYEAVGELDPRLETACKWKEPYREGIVYYLRAGKVRGVLLWNVWEKVGMARALISGSRTFTSDELESAIPI